MKTFGELKPGDTFIFFPENPDVENYLFEKIEPTLFGNSIKICNKTLCKVDDSTLIVKIYLI